MRRNRIPVLLALAIVSSCEEAELLTPDVTEACASPRACQVTGVDLVVEPPALLVASDHVRDPLTGRIVVMANESVPVAIAVWNRGDAPSDSATLIAYLPQDLGSDTVVTVPPLVPGGVFTDTVTWRLPVGIIARSDTAWLHAELRGLQPSEDPLNGNDANDSDTVIVALPVLRATLQFPDTVQAEVPFPATVTVRNLSRFGDLTPRAMAFCLFDYDVGCGSWAGEPFQLTAVPAIPAGGSWTGELEVTIPDHGPYYSPWDWNLYACFADAGSDLDTFLDWRARRCTGDGRPITVLDPPPGGRPGGAR
jgi:hypothetical protein